MKRLGLLITIFTYVVTAFIFIGIRTCHGLFCFGLSIWYLLPGAIFGIKKGSKFAFRFLMVYIPIPILLFTIEWLANRVSRRTGEKYVGYDSVGYYTSSMFYEYSLPFIIIFPIGLILMRLLVRTILKFKKNIKKSGEPSTS